MDSDDFDNNSDGEDKGEGEQEEEVAAASHAAAANPDDAAALRERAAVVAEVRTYAVPVELVVMSQCTSRLFVGVSRVCFVCRCP